MFEDAWWEGFDELLAIFAAARSRTVRDPVLAMLEKHHGDELAALRSDRLLPLLRSEVPEVQTLALDLLQSAPGLESLPIAEWLSLLSLERSTVLQGICDLVKRHVSPDRLSLAQCLELATSQAAPAAELGLSWAKARPIRAEDLRALVRLCLTAKAPRLRADAAAWAVSILKERPETTPELVRELLDSQHREVRARALELMLGEARFKDQTSLWVALAESPWDDVRAELARHLEERVRLLSRSRCATSGPACCSASTAAAARSGAWCGSWPTASPARGRGEVAPAAALGLAALGARPERRSALAGLAQAAFREPKLRAAIGAALPELKLFAEEAAA
jgi:hypothetical protein